MTVNGLGVAMTVSGLGVAMTVNGLGVAMTEEVDFQGHQLGTGGVWSLGVPDATAAFFSAFSPP